MLKTDGDLIVLPARYIDELRNHPPAQLSSLDAQYNVCGISSIFGGETGQADRRLLWKNVLGKYTNVLVESRLPSLTVTKRLNPAIGK